MKRYSILIVDDEKEMRMALRIGLTRAGYVVDDAEDGQKALAMNRSRQYDLIISDIKMPKMDGIAFLKELRCQNLTQPIIIMSAHGTIDTAVEAMKLGASDFVVKPFSVEIIETLVKRFINAPVQSNTDRSAIVTKDKTMLKILGLIDSIATSKATVLLQGESGTGKEILARQVHDRSDRSKGPFIAINCAALPENLLESELFGHEKGAFTGALDRKIGKFELANGGTILLDEISEMNLFLQAKLLRVLQEHTIDRVGGKESVKLDIRVVATTNRDLKEYVKAGKFREDLFYRLNVIPIHVPPLRERQEDIETLVNYFISLLNRENSLGITGITGSCLSKLKAYRWVGNVRELRNYIERAMLIAGQGQLKSEHFLLTISDTEEQSVPDKDQRASELATEISVGTTLRDLEKMLIVKTLTQLEGNRTHAAATLGISIRTLRNKLREYRQDGLFAEC